MEIFYEWAAFVARYMVVFDREEWNWVNKTDLIEVNVEAWDNNDRRDEDNCRMQTHDHESNYEASSMTRCTTNPNYTAIIFWSPCQPTFLYTSDEEHIGQITAQ